MIGHAPSDQCELPVRSMDFNGNTWRKTHLEELEGRSKAQTLFPELSKLLDADTGHNVMTIMDNQTKDLVHPTSIRKVLSADSAQTESATSADPRHCQNEGVPLEPQTDMDSTSSTSNSSLADSAIVDKSKSKESNILSLMLQTVSNIGSVPSNSRTSHSRRKRPATKNHRKNNKCSYNQEIGNTKLVAEGSGPVELEMSCEEDELDESQLNASSQYSEAIARYKEEMNVYVQEMERYLLEKHGLNDKGGSKTDAPTSSMPPDAFVKFSRGVQATPLELSENILISPAVELDLSSTNGEETTEVEENYQHELSEGQSISPPSASPLTIPTTQTKMHLTHSTPRNRFQRSSAPVPSSVTKSQTTTNNSASTQVLAELEKVCDQLPGISSQFSPSVNSSVSDVPVATSERVHSHDRSVMTAGFSSPPHPDMSTSQQNHHTSPPVSMMQQQSGQLILPPPQQMSEKQSIGKNISYLQHRGVKRSHPSSNTSPGHSSSNGPQSPEDASRIPDQSPSGYLPPFQPFPGKRPFHHTYPPTAGVPEGSNMNVRPCGESNLRFPDPNNMRFPESNSLRFPEPHSFRFHEPNNIRFPEPSSMQFSEPNCRYPEPSGMRFPFPPYRGNMRPHNHHIYPPGSSSMRITEPHHVHPSPSSVTPVTSRSRRKSSGNQQATSPVVSLPHNMTVSQGSHTIKYRPEENVTVHFERTYKEIMQRHSKNPSYDVRVRHPWQHMQIHPGGTRPGLQQAPRTNFLREKLTAPPSPWLYNKHPLSQSAHPRMHQQPPYSDFLSGNMRGPPPFNPQIPSSMSEWLDCSPVRNMIQDSQPNLMPPLLGNFDHPNALHPLSQTDSASASPSGLRPSPLNPISPVDAVQQPRGTQNTKHPSSVQSNRQAVRGFNHLPPLISVSEPNCQTQLPVPSQQLSPKGNPRPENGPSVNSIGHIVQNSAPRMPQIASIQSFAGSKDVSVSVTGPDQGQQEPVMPKIARVHSADRSDDQVLDLSQHAESPVTPVTPHFQGPLQGGDSSSGHLQTKSGSAVGSSLCRILQGVASLTNSQNRDHVTVTSSSSSSSSSSSLPARNHELVATSATAGDGLEAESSSSTGFSSPPSNQGQVGRTHSASKSSQENILSVPDVTSRSKSLPRIALTGAEYQPRGTDRAAIAPPPANFRRSHSQSHSHKRKKKHEHRSSSKSKKKRRHHSHEREMDSNFPAVLKIPDVKKALRESTTMTLVTSEERSSTNSSSETMGDHEISSADHASNSSDKEPETNPAARDTAESTDTSVSTVQSSSVNVSVTNTLSGSSETVVSSPSVSGPVMPTPTPYSDALVKLSSVPAVAPPRPIILQAVLTPRIVLPTNITVVQQRNIVVAPVLQVSTTEQVNQSLSVSQPAENSPPVSLSDTTRKNTEVVDASKSLSVLESPEEVNQGAKTPTLECYEETLEQGVVESSSGTTETSPTTLEDVTVTLPVSGTSVLSLQGTQQEPPDGNQTESSMANEETNLFDRVASYMSNLEKQNSKHEQKTKSPPEPPPGKVSIPPGREKERMKESVASRQLKRCTLRLVPRKNKDGGKTSGRLELSRDKCPPTSGASTAVKNKITAAKWDKYYGYRKGKLPQHQHNTRFKIVCYHCDNMMSDNVTYMDHVESVIEKSCPASKIKQLCKICFQTLSTTDVASHVAKSHPLNGKYCCKICNINFPVRRDFKFHMKRVHKGLTMPYVCKICLFQTSFHADLKEHFLAEHRGSKALMCYFCTKILYSSRSFLAHFTKHYAKESGVSCPDCVLLYLSNSACKEHLANDHQTFEWNERDGKPKHDSLEPLRKLASAVEGSRKVKENLPSKDDEDVIEITDDDDDDEEEEEDGNKTWKCLECGGTYAHLSEHLITKYSCQNCKYYTHCSSAYTQHVVAFHSSFQDAPVLHPVKKSQVFGGYLLKCRRCGFQTSFATSMSEHIVSCPKGVSVLDSFPYLREKALSQIALKENHGKDTLVVPDVISVEKIN